MNHKQLSVADARRVLNLPENGPATTSIPAAGKLLFNASRNRSYEAAARGEIFTIPYGRLRKVPVIWLAMRVMVQAADEAAADAEDEDNIRRDLGAVMIERTGMFVDGQKTAHYDRKREWGLVGRAERIANNLIGRLIEEAADGDAIRIARRFPITERAQIYRAASTSVRFHQLAETFPYLAAHLLRMLKTKEVRFYDAYKMVERGAPLREVANICDIPMVLRKIPPGAVKNAGCSFFREHPDLVHA